MNSNIKYIYIVYNIAGRLSLLSVLLSNALHSLDPPVQALQREITQIDISK